MSAPDAKCGGCGHTHSVHLAMESRDMFGESRPVRGCLIWGCRCAGFAPEEA